MKLDIILFLLNAEVFVKGHRELVSVGKVSKGGSSPFVERNISSHLH